MASANRTAQLSRIHRVLKKHFKPYPPEMKRPLLEQLLFASLLEEAPPEAAEKCFASLDSDFFDLNEVRVSTVRELAEGMKSLPDPMSASLRLKNTMQSVFEAVYAFDLEPLKKQNIGQAVKKLEKFEGTTPFMVAYVTQVSLGGHSIPVNRGSLGSLVVLGVISEADAEKSRVPGIERAIPKKKGVEFASLLHRLGLMFASNPYGPNVRKLLLEIDPGCKERLPKRGAAQAEKARAEAAALEAKEEAANKAKAKAKAKADAAKKGAAAKKSPAKKGPAAKKPTTKKKQPAKKKAPVKKKTKKAPPKKTTKKAAAKKKAQKGKTARKPTKKKKTQAAGKKTKKTTSKRLSRRKPR